MPRLIRVLTIAVLLLAACTNRTPGSGSPLESAGASSERAALDCTPLDLRMPSGELIDLTGTWEGGATVHYVRQIGDCVWWIALSDWPDQALGDFYSITFSGHLSPDFTLQGNFAAILRPNMVGVPISPRGHVKFEIDVPEPNSKEPLTLRQVDVIDPSEGGYVDITLRLIGPLPLPVIP